jgi:DNA (cytosine-5)-methyltransferase 1
MKKPPKEHRINLRLPQPAFIAIEQLMHEGKGKLSYNAWVVQAIQEKIERDRVRETSPAYRSEAQKTFYEFFAGGGMARLGMGKEWGCLFANDFDSAKARAYRENWEGGRELKVEDVNKLTTTDLPGTADLVWASFPCQDLSLAGKYAGIGNQNDHVQTRSGTFWPFWRLMNGLADEDRKPKVIVLENVYGALTSNQSKDFAAIGSAFVKSGYKFGAVVIDAKWFVPQSRPRVFIIGVQADLAIQPELISAQPAEPWHVAALQSAYMQLSEYAKKQWVWWVLPKPKQRRQIFADVIEETPEGVNWHTPSETKRLLAMMTPLNLKKVEQAKRSGVRSVGGVYRRTRSNEYGEKVQRAEVRFDDIAGCLRTPSGGSSRQLILVVEKGRIRSRLLSSREAARLMGLPDSYKLPKNYNEAYHLCGDGVVAPAVRHLTHHLLNALIENNRAETLLSQRVA